MGLAKGENLWQRWKEFDWHFNGNVKKKKPSSKQFSSEKWVNYCRKISDVFIRKRKKLLKRKWMQINLRFSYSKIVVLFFFSACRSSPPPSPPAPVLVKYSHIGCRRQFNGIIWSHLPNYNCFRPNISVMHIQEIKTEYKKQWTRRTLASCLPVTNLLFKPSIWVEKFYLNQLLNQTQHRFCWNVLYLPHVPGLLVGTTIRIMLIYFKCPCILLSCYFLTMSLFCFLEKKFWVETFFLPGGDTVCGPFIYSPIST